MCRADIWLTTFSCPRRAATCCGCAPNPSFLAGLIARRPQLWAIEPFARLSRVLAGEALQREFSGSTEQLSIAGSTVTFQQLKAVQDSGGGAVVVHDPQARAGVAALAREGLWGELCTGATVARPRAAERDEDPIESGAHVMLLFHRPRRS